MKKIIYFLVMLLFTYGALVANDISITVTDGGGLTFNEFPLSYLDPTSSMARPVLFSLEIKNTSANPVAYDLQVSLTSTKYTTPLLTNSLVEANKPLNPNESIEINSQQIITKDSDFDFVAHFDIDDVLTSNSDFEDFVMETGFLPDGIYTFEVVAVNKGSSNPISNVASVTITITKPTTISLTRPGGRLGGMGFIVNPQNLEFSWSANLQEYTLTIFEIPSNAEFDEDFIKNLAPHHVETNIIGETFTYPLEAPALIHGRRYAWIVTAGLLTPEVGGVDLDRSKVSNVFIFRVEPNDELEDHFPPPLVSPEDALEPGSIPNPEAPSTPAATRVEFLSGMQIDELFSIFQTISDPHAQEALRPLMEILQEGYSINANSIVYRGNVISFEEFIELVKNRLIMALEI